MEVAAEHEDEPVTPTRVGRTDVARRYHDVASCYPHACGEDRPRDPAKLERWLLPPRVWGGRSRSMAGVDGVVVTPTRVGRTPMSGRRISLAIPVTPTRVGRTPSTPLDQLLCTCYPHACGEDHSLGSLEWPVLLLPPRVWGGLAQRFTEGDSLSVTPTRVGRICAIRLASATYRLLPPRVWGGRRCSRPLASYGLVCYPHACGEDASRSQRGAGSSPCYPHACGEDPSPPGLL